MDLQHSLGTLICKTQTLTQLITSILTSEVSDFLNQLIVLCMLNNIPSIIEFES